MESIQSRFAVIVGMASRKTPRIDRSLTRTEEKTMKPDRLRGLLLHSAVIATCFSTGIAMAQTQIKTPRFPQLTMEQLNPRQEALAQEILKYRAPGSGALQCFAT